MNTVVYTEYFVCISVLLYATALTTFLVYNLSCRNVQAIASNKPKQNNIVYVIGLVSATTTQDNNIRYSGVTYSVSDNSLGAHVLFFVLQSTTCIKRINKVYDMRNTYILFTFFLYEGSYRVCTPDT